MLAMSILSDSRINAAINNKAYISQYQPVKWDACFPNKVYAIKVCNSAQSTRPRQLLALCIIIMCTAGPDT